MNVPYVKQYDENGLITNPIVGKYTNNFLNRSNRREKPPRFMNNSNSTHIVVNGGIRYLKSLQKEVDKEGKLKYIYHYILKLNK